MKKPGSFAVETAKHPYNLSEFDRGLKITQE
jgi:hypothetical protein